MTDIEELERLGAEAMRSPTNRDGSRCDWRVHESTELGSCVASAHGYTICGPIAGQSARYICAIHNALPGLFAELRALREVAEAARDYRETNDDGHRCGGSSGDQCAGCLLQAALAALAKVPK